MSNIGPIDEVSDEGTPYEDLPDGSGCFEIWEYLSDVRNESGSD